MNAGLTSREWKTFDDMVAKANVEQWIEMRRRIERVAR